MPLMFMAGMDKNEHKRFRESCASHVRNFMYTYFDFRGEKGEAYFLKSMDQIGMWRPDARLFLDSGAFSAFTLGQPISLDEYMLFLEKYEDQFFMYANLDNKADQQETYDNFKILRANGFTPAAVWHGIGSPIELLEEYMGNATVPMVAIGAIAKEKITDDYSYKRINSVFNLVAKYNKPVHAFGRTEPELHIRYPFTSADSSTWYVVRMGAILSWNPMARTLRQIRMRNAAAMEREFGPRAKTLIGRTHHLNKPHYIVATEHNIEQMYIMEQALEAYWKKRGVTWDYDAIDRKLNVDPKVKKRCVSIRKRDGTPLPGDIGYTSGMYAGLDGESKKRARQKWEFNNEVLLRNTSD